MNVQRVNPPLSEPVVNENLKPTDCFICFRIMQKAVVLNACGHSFCKPCITKAKVVKNECPKCKAVIINIIPNIDLRGVIQAKTAKNGPAPNPGAANVEQKMAALSFDPPAAPHPAAAKSAPTVSDPALQSPLSPALFQIEKMIKNLRSKITSFSDRSIKDKCLEIVDLFKRRMKAIEVALSTLNSARPILENTKEMIQSRLGELKSGGSNESDKNRSEESVNIMLKHLETISSQTISKRAVLEQIEVNQLLYLEHDSPVASFAVSPNDRFLVSQDVGNAKYGFHIWDLERDEKLKTIEMDKGIGKMNFSFTPDSKYLLAGYSNGDVWILSFPDLKKVGEIHAHEKNAELLGYSSNDQWLLTRGTSHKSGELCSWKVEKRDTNSPQFTPQAKIALEQDMQSLCFSPTEPLIAYRSTKDRSTDEISVWDVPGLKKIATIQRSNVITSLQFSPDGRTLLIAEQGNVYSWDWKMKAQPRVLFTELGAIKNMHFIRGTGNLAYICSMEVSSIHDCANSTVCIRDINTVKAVGSFYAPDAWSGNFQISPLGKFALKIKKGLTDILVWKLGEIPQKD